VRWDGLPETWVTANQEPNLTIRHVCEEREGIEKTTDLTTKGGWAHCALDAHFLRERVYMHLLQQHVSEVDGGGGEEAPRNFSVTNRTARRTGENIYHDVRNRKSPPLPKPLVFRPS